MKTGVSLTAVMILLFSLTFSACDNSFSGDDSETPPIKYDPNPGGQTNNTIVSATYSIPHIITLFNPLRACYNITWSPGISGATGYNVYKSTSPDGGTNSKIYTGTDTLHSDTEPFYSDGTYIRYYWVTAQTTAGETARPANGGIKVTYKVTLAQKIMIPGSPPYYIPTYITIGTDTITRTIEQNPTH